MKSFNFDQQEVEHIAKFDKLLNKEANLLSRLFQHKEHLISQINGKIKSDDYPLYPIEVLLVYNTTIIFSSYDRLRKGYFGLSQSILRSAIENIAFSMYFYEFPEDEKLYREKRGAFYGVLKQKGYSNWIQGILQRIDKEGTKFSKLPKEDGKSWEKFLFNNLGDLASHFTHTNLDSTLSVVFSHSEQEKDYYTYGPNWIGTANVKSAIWTIIETLLIDEAVFDRVFKDHIKSNDFTLIKEGVEKLNQWLSSVKTS